MYQVKALLGILVYSGNLQGLFASHRSQKHLNLFKKMKKISNFLNFLKSVKPPNIILLLILVKGTPSKELLAADGFLGRVTCL